MIHFLIHYLLLYLLSNFEFESHIFTEFQIQTRNKVHLNSATTLITLYSRLNEEN